MKQKQKVWIRGCFDRGTETIAKLSAQGGINGRNLAGTNSRAVYFINHEGCIQRAEEETELGRVVMECYSEIKTGPTWHDGDILKLAQAKETYAMFKHTSKENSGYFVPYLYVMGWKKESSISTDACNVIDVRWRLALPEEKNRFQELLHKHGLHWDTKSKQLVYWQWAPRQGERFYFLSSQLKPTCELYKQAKGQTYRIHIGNCFRTYEECSKKAKEVRQFLSVIKNNKKQDS